MIIYKDILKKLKAAGYPTSRLRNEKILSESTLVRIRQGNTITTETLNTICRITKLPISELIEYVDDEPDAK